jgi:hypothetical protein
MPGPLPRRAHRVHLPNFFLHGIGLPQQGCGSASPLLSANTIFHGAYFRGCRHSLMFKPPTLHTSQIVPTPARYRRRAAEAFYIRAKHASLPPHASDMLAARVQAIGGTGTLTPQDSQPCRLLPPVNASAPPCEVHRMTRGHCGSLTLQCMTLFIHDPTPVYPAALRILLGLHRITQRCHCSGRKSIIVDPYIVDTSPIKVGSAGTSIESHGSTGNISSRRS